jgi:hypothetical protein
MSIDVFVAIAVRMVRTPAAVLHAIVQRRPTRGGAIGGGRFHTGAVRVAVDSTPADGYIVEVRNLSTTPLYNLRLRAPRADWQWAAWPPADQETRGYGTGAAATETFADRPPFVAHLRAGSVAFLLRSSHGSQLPHWLMVEWDDPQRHHNQRRVLLHPESQWLS